MLSIKAFGNLEAIHPATGATSIRGAADLPSVNALGAFGGTAYTRDYGNNLSSLNTSNGSLHLDGATGIPVSADPAANLCETLFSYGGSLVRRL